MKTDTTMEVTKKCKKSNDCKCGFVLKGVCVISFVVTCYFIYRVTELESRVDYLERKFEKLFIESRKNDVASVRGSYSQETLSRQKRDTTECQCPPGKNNETLYRVFFRIYCLS